MRKKHFADALALSGVCFLISIVAHAGTPLREIAGLTSITFWEATSGVDPITFVASSSEVTTRLPDPLSSSNNDFRGAGTEFYDVYYSDRDGAYNIGGEFMTVTAVYPLGSPWGGALNLAEIELRFADGQSEFGSCVSSYLALGDNAYPESVDAAIDGDLSTYTTLGNTSGEEERLRITIGFTSSSGPCLQADPCVTYPGTLPVYRFWGLNNARHFYTINEDEKNYIIEELGDQWQYEGIGWCAYPPYQ